MEERHLSSHEYFWVKWFEGNTTSNNATDIDLLEKASDVSVDAVITSLYFNAIVFVVLMATYEALRRLFPAVYSSRKRKEFARPEREEASKQFLPEEPIESTGADTIQSKASLAVLPDDRPLDWIGPVFGVPWVKVRKLAGLDGYFFLRYIRMNVRITAVSSFWFFLILVPLYATGHSEAQSARGWYHLSMANIPTNGWRMWIPCLFLYMFTGFILFVIKQEFRHYLDLRQDFLARGNAHVDPQHHYSLVVENIPQELRSDRALKEYFDKLFPCRVHSACVVLKVPDVEEASLRCMRTCRRLEKSIAYWHATGDRPTHIVGRGRISCLGIDLQPFDCGFTDDNDTLFIEDDIRAKKPEKGTRVDSISYYTQELASHSRNLYKIQKRKAEIAETGNSVRQLDNWLEKVARQATIMADQIMVESLEDNDLLTPQNLDTSAIPQAENMTSQYGSFNRASEKSEPLVGGSQKAEYNPFPTPFGSEKYSSNFRRWAGRLGLDFIIAGFKFFSKQVDVAIEEVVGATMSSTGYVTFLDLVSTTNAASAPLTAKANTLDVAVAPEPRDIIWTNAHISKRMKDRRSFITNCVLSVGMLLWVFPLLWIQLFANVDNLKILPGLEWIDTFNGGTLKKFVNGYLPVVALLTFILILPVIFEYVARKYERRKTFSDVQSSMLSRYFNYQLANVFITVTAGTLFKSVPEIIDRPSKILQILGESLPTMVGYFVALLVTKIMAGLPMVFLRIGALFRMCTRRLLSNQKKMTQREVDALYQYENVQYGWEFPTQLLVVVIVFTYAVICPIILPVGLIYFTGALIVYKKQVLYVYSPVYESGGAMFPVVVQRTLFGLVCSQLTFLGYVLTRKCIYQPMALFPLPVFTVLAMSYFHQYYGVPSTKLSLERARECDRTSALKAQALGDTFHSQDHEDDAGVQDRSIKFDRNSYRQPILTELATEPQSYRSGAVDDETESVRKQLRRINRYVSRAQEVNSGRGLSSPI